MSRLISLVKAHTSLSNLVHSLSKIVAFFERRLISTTFTIPAKLGISGVQSEIQNESNTNAPVTEPEDYRFWENDVRAEWMIVGSGRYLVSRLPAEPVYQPPRENASAAMCLECISILPGASRAPTSARRCGPPRRQLISKSLRSMGSRWESQNDPRVSHLCRCVRRKLQHFLRMAHKEGAQRTHSVNVRLIRLRLGEEFGASSVTTKTV